MTGQWRVTYLPLGLSFDGWIVRHGDRIAVRRTASGHRTNFWPTREAAERACARLNRKYLHECPGLYDCDPHPVPHVARSRAGHGWYSGGHGIFVELHQTYAEAFAAGSQWRAHLCMIHDSEDEQHECDDDCEATEAY